MRDRKTSCRERGEDEVADGIRAHCVTGVQTCALPIFLSWPASETETRVEFDRPIDPTKLKDLAKSIIVTAGRFVAAGDRFESLRPGYQTVQNQLAQPRYERSEDVV